MEMIKVWWRTGFAAKPDQNLTEGLRLYLQGRVPSPTLAAFDPGYRTLSDDETDEILNRRTLGGRPVRLEDGPD
jgi:hypothetical protein